MSDLFKISENHFFIHNYGLGDSHLYVKKTALMRLLHVTALPSDNNIAKTTRLAMFSNDLGLPEFFLGDLHENDL